MPPSVKLRGRLADTPYIEVIKLASQTIGTKAQVLHPSFERPPGMSLRDYIYMLCNYDVIGVPKSLADKFIDQYDQARFSGKLITEAQFSDFMESCHKILVSMKYRDVASLLFLPKFYQDTHQLAITTILLVNKFSSLLHQYGHPTTPFLTQTISLI